MAKAKTKAKLDFKQLLLNKGEYLALGVAGLFLAILLFSGVSMWSSAKDPKTIADGLSTSAKAVHNRINNGQLTDADLALTIAPGWAVKPPKYPPVPVSEFAISGPQFDPIAKPDTKRENPMVYAPGQQGYGDLQVNLVRVPFKAFDIVNDGDNYKIAVITDKSVGKMSDDDQRKLLIKVQNKPNRGRSNAGQGFNPGATPFQPAGPGGIGPGGPGGPGGMGPGRGPGGRPGMSGQGQGGSYEINAKRAALKYIPLEDLDKAIAAGESPAMTVIPLRGVLIHMEVPFKKQVEEIKRALRVSTEEAKSIGPVYEGYEVQRKVSQMGPDGKLEEVLPWTNYNFEDAYQKLINAKKLGDTIESDYLSYFIRYDMQLVLPLPQLVSELGNYPPIRLANINEAIQKLQKQGVQKAQESEVLSRLQGTKPNNELYQPQTGADTGASQLYGQSYGGPGLGKMKGPGLGVGPGGDNRPKDGPGGPHENAPALDLDYLLLRFVDVAIDPGYTYEYRIRLKMRNPNFEKPDEVANPIDATKKYLYSPYTEIQEKITIPAENFVFAADVANYRKTIEETYQGNRIAEKDLREKLQAKDYQAVVEMCKWLMEVSTGSGKREPVGAWVVAEIPVGRGEYVGRRQFVKLPLWSSETKSYVLREISATTGVGKKDINQPKGWVVDFTSPDILVDFSGGRVPTRVGQRTVVEDAGTEMLIVAPDGRLTVKKSLVDENDAKRKEISSVWTKWVSDVENKGKNVPGENTDPFAPKP